MSAAQPQVSWDDRPCMERLGRVALYKELEARGIPFPAGSPKTVMLDLLKANGVDLTQPSDIHQWQPVHGQDEHGRQHVELVPITPVHESARIQGETGELIDYDAAIKERAEANEALEQKTELADMQATMLSAMDERMKLLESRTLPLDKMMPYQLKEIAKNMNIDVSGLTKKDELLKALEG